MASSDTDNAVAGSAAIFYAFRTVFELNVNLHRYVPDAQVKCTSAVIHHTFHHFTLNCMPSLHKLHLLLSSLPLTRVQLTSVSLVPAAQSTGTAWMEECSAELFLLEEPPQTHFFLLWPLWKAVSHHSIGGQTAKTLSKEIVCLELLRKTPGRRQMKNLVTWISVLHLKLQHCPSLQRGLVYHHHNFTDPV